MKVEGEDALPHAVPAKAHEVVHAVVRLGDAGEDAGDALALLALGDGLEAKVGWAGGVGDRIFRCCCRRCRRIRGASRSRCRKGPCQSYLLLGMCDGAPHSGERPSVSRSGSHCELGNGVPVQLRVPGLGEDRGQLMDASFGSRKSGRPGTWALWLALWLLSLVCGVRGPWRGYSRLRMSSVALSLPVGNTTPNTKTRGMDLVRTQLLGLGVGVGALSLARLCHRAAAHPDKIDGQDGKEAGEAQREQHGDDNTVLGIHCLLVVVGGWL